MSEPVVDVQQAGSAVAQPALHFHTPVFAQSEMQTRDEVPGLGLVVPTSDTVLYVILIQLFIQIILAGTLFPLPDNPYRPLPR